MNDFQVNFTRKRFFYSKSSKYVFTRFKNIEIKILLGILFYSNFLVNKKKSKKSKSILT